MILPTAEFKYEIYNHVAESGGHVYDHYEAPWHVNYKTGLVKTLAANVEKMVLGEALEIVRYADYDPEADVYATPVVREIFEYFRDPITNWARYRTQEAHFYLKSGEIGPHPKIFLPKPYRTIGAKRKEIARKRRNQTSRASEVAVGALVQGGMDIITASKEGQAYWATLVGEISLYEEGNLQPLRDRIATDSSPAWLSSIRSILLAELA